MARTANRRRNKKIALMYEQPEDQGDFLSIPTPVETENLADKLDRHEHAEIISILQDRYYQAQPTTDWVRSRMADWEKMYEGEYIEAVENGIIYFPKAREYFEVINAYIINLVQQLNPLLEAVPRPKSLYAADEDLQKAKVVEAMLLYYFEDVWNFKTVKLTEWLKPFMKHTVGVWKLNYVEDDFFPSLDLKIVDRANLYFDPAAKDVKECRWLMERYWLPISEVERRLDAKIWKNRWKDDIYHHLNRNGGATDTLNSEVLERTMTGGTDAIYGTSFVEDDLVECIDYWQSPGYGMKAVYCAMVGGITGEIVWYGENPFPYKGIPYRGKSYDPHEYKIDGQSFLQKQEQIQELINNVYNLRLQDIRENITSPVFIPQDLINSETKTDFENGSKFIRLDKTAVQGLISKNMRLSDVIYNLPVTTSTAELFQDFTMAMGQSQQSSQVSEVFRGQSPQVQATLGQVNEQIVRSQGVFKPVITQVMRGIEEIAEMMIVYFQSEDFFPDKRIITMMGASRYEKWLPHIKKFRGSNMFAMEVGSDLMDVDVRITAISGADAQMQKAITIGNINQLLATVSTLPEMYQEAKKKINFPAILENILRNTVHDYEHMVYTDEEQQQNAQQEQEQQKQQLQQQIELQQQQIRFAEMTKSEAKRIEQQSRAESQIAIDQNQISTKATSDLARDQMQQQQEAVLIREREQEKLEADLVRQIQDLEHRLILMRQEAVLERDPRVQSVGSHK